MRTTFITILVIALIFPFRGSSQDDGAAVAAAAGALLAIGAGVAAVERMKEQAELDATEWLIANHPEYTSFSLKTIDFDGKKVKDMSSVSVITFKIQEFQPADKPQLNGSKKVLFGFTSHGWITEFGIDFNKVRWYLIDANEWMNMMTAYVKVASSEKNDATIKDKLRQGKVVNKGVKDGGKMVVPFYQLEGDMYLVGDYSDDMKFVYNEKSLGIYLKETMNLVQIGRGDIIKIHDFFYGEE